MIYSFPYPLFNQRKLKKPAQKSHNYCWAKCGQVVSKFPKGQVTDKFTNDLSTRSRSDCPQSSVATRFNNSLYPFFRGLSQ